MERRVLAWMQPHLESGELPVLPPTVYWGVLMGPSDHVARQWANDPSSVDLETSRHQLEEAAWGAVLRLREPRT